MADEPLIELINKNHAATTALQARIRDMESDGVEGDEAQRIAENKKQIGKLAVRLKELEAQFNANKAEWSRLSGDLAKAKTQIATLKDWGVNDVSAMEAMVKSIETAAKNQRYRGAIDQLAELKTSLAAPYAEYTKQHDAMEPYETEAAALRGRIDTAKRSTFQTDNVKAGITQAETDMVAIGETADGKDYVKARSLVVTSGNEMKSVEDAIQKAGIDDQQVREGLDALNTRVAEADQTEFDELKPRIEQVRTGVATAEGQRTSFKFNDALDQIATLDHELDAISAKDKQLAAEKAAEEAEKAKLKAEWERNSGRWDDFKKKVADLEHWEMPEAKDMRRLVSEIEAAVGEEGWEIATTKLGEAEKAIQKPYAEFLIQLEAQQTYTNTRSGLDSRAEAAGKNGYADTIVVKDLADLVADFDFMDTQAKAKDFVKANSRISTVTGKLDKIEQALRELEIRAKVAEEMGGASSADVEREVSRRLYVEERTDADSRIAAAGKDDVLDASSQAQLDQVKKGLDDAKTAFDGGSYAEALALLRTGIGEMPAIEERVRTQLELKHRYDRAMDDVTKRLEALSKSQYAQIRASATALESSLGETRKKAEAHDFEGALPDAETAKTELDLIQSNESDLAKLEAQASADMIAIQPRLSRALSNDAEALRGGVDGLRAKLKEVEDLAHDEKFAEAITATAELKTLLEEFEEEAELEAERSLYLSALDTLDIEGKVVAMHATLYPETEDQQGAVDTADGERISLAERQEYADARSKAFAEDDLLDDFDAQVAKIDIARGYYEQGAALLKTDYAKAMAPADEMTAELKLAQDELKAIMDQLDQAVGEQRYLKAAELYDEAGFKVEEVLKLQFEATKIDEKVTTEWITSAVAPGVVAVSAGASDAVGEFHTFILGKVTGDRPSTQWGKWGGFVFDVAGCANEAIAVALAVTAPEVALVIAAIKIGISLVTSEIDETEDERDKRLAEELITKLMSQSGEVSGCVTKDYGGDMKSQARGTYDKIGRHLTRKEYPEARSLLSKAGAPMGLDVTVTKKIYYDQLVSRFNSTRG